ncbi:MAG: redoxin domain-containing protein [Mariniblastus sp.]
MTKQLISFSNAWLMPLVVFLAAASSAVGDDGSKEVKTSRSLKIGQPMPEFELKDFEGKPWKSSELKSKAVAVVFVGVECPLVKLYAPRLSKLKSELGELQIIAVNSNRHDSISDIAKFAKANNVTFPLLKDPANRVADLFGAERTPQVFLFNAQRKLVYSGAIDDQYTYGRQKDKVEKTYLKDAVESVIKGESPAIASTKPDGCIIGRVLAASENSEVTYANQVSRILNAHCVNCHRSGEVAPFSLTDYEEVVGWAEMINEVVAERRMPPWHADPKHGKFKNDISLTKKQREQINTWVENGAPMGDPKNLPEPPTFVEGWGMGEPDLVVPMSKKPFKVKATGVLEYKHFVVDPGFKEDKWITAAECRIGNRAVVHHMIVAADEGRNGRKSPHERIRSEWITATAPGSPPMILPEGYAKFIPAGSKLVFQLHYTPNGTAQTDISSVGFKFADPKTVRKIVSTREIMTKEFTIPAGAGNHKVEVSHTILKDVVMLSLFPHMHLRGKSFRYTAKYDGKEEILLDVPNYDFNWQNGYELEEPRLFKAGTEIVCTAHFDNSAENFANPAPDKDVYWGDQTFEEMMIGYVNVALADQDLIRERKKK